MGMVLQDVVHWHSCPAAGLDKVERACSTPREALRRIVDKSLEDDEQRWVGRSHAGKLMTTKFQLDHDKSPDDNQEWTMRNMDTKTPGMMAFQHVDRLVGSQ